MYYLTILKPCALLIYTNSSECKMYLAKNVKVLILLFLYQIQQLSAPTAAVIDLRVIYSDWKSTGCHINSGLKQSSRNKNEKNNF